ncbi:concanavalin A-like lectin/glucanase domain-containing protein [Aspergillus karnatakaensis]|uniref:glycoside hydrolase family 16 protein n=1 Tax=Aspergillus karnatakaensis TaxID=1810916 RepID=UPI003CCE476A
MSLIKNLALLAACISPVVAQTWTHCNPTKEECDPNPALSTEATWGFNKTLNDKIWNVTNGVIDYTDEGAEFTINRKLESPTVHSVFYIFFGVVEAHVKMAKGPGIVSSVVLQSDDLDEIDWEWVGFNTTQIQTNYYSKGITDYENGGFFYVENADTEFHNYTTYWTQEKIEWWVDGQLLRTLTYDEAKNGTQSTFPQTPCNVRIGIWPAGDPKNAQGTIEWAGGPVDYDKGPYTMVVKDVRVQDFSSGKAYEYGDDSGMWESINIIKGNSTAAEEISKPPPKSLSEKWNDLPGGAKAGVYAGAAGVGAILLALFIFFYIRQRKKGRLEHALDDAKWATERNEMNNFQSNWKQSEWKHGGYKAVQ